MSCTTQPQQLDCIGISGVKTRGSAIRSKRVLKPDIPESKRQKISNGTDTKKINLTTLELIYDEMTMKDGWIREIHGTYVNKFGINLDIGKHTTDTVRLFVNNTFKDIFEKHNKTSDSIINYIEQDSAPEYSAFSGSEAAFTDNENTAQQIISNEQHGSVNRRFLEPHNLSHGSIGFITKEVSPGGTSHAITAMHTFLKNHNTISAYKGGVPGYYFTEESRNIYKCTAKQSGGFFGVFRKLVDGVFVKVAADIALLEVKVHEQASSGGNGEQLEVFEGTLASLNKDTKVYIKRMNREEPCGVIQLIDYGVHFNGVHARQCFVVIPHKDCKLTEFAKQGDSGSLIYIKKINTNVGIGLVFKDSKTYREGSTSMQHQNCVIGVRLDNCLEAVYGDSWRTACQPGENWDRSRLVKASLP